MTDAAIPGLLLCFVVSRSSPWSLDRLLAVLHQLILRSANRMDKHVRSRANVDISFTDQTSVQDVFAVSVNWLLAITFPSYANHSAREHRPANHGCRYRNRKYCSPRSYSALPLIATADAPRGWLCRNNSRFGTTRRGT